MSCCNGCTACCRGEAIALRAGEDPTGWDTVAEGGRFWLRHVDGNCVYLKDDGCSIHGRQPRACQEFNCVEYFKSLSRPDRRRREKVHPNAKAVFAAARERMNP